MIIINYGSVYIVVDPVAWNEAHVRHWIQWAVKEFSLVNVDVDNFVMNGQQLCELRHEDFVKYIPSDKGDIFWTHLELLRKCKFVGKLLKWSIFSSIDAFFAVLVHAW